MCITVRLVVSGTRLFAIRLSPYWQLMIYDTKTAPSLPSESSLSFGARASATKVQEESVPTLSTTFRDQTKLSIPSEPKSGAVIVAVPCDFRDIFVDAEWNKVANEILNVCDKAFEPENLGFSFGGGHQYGAQMQQSKMLEVKQLGKNFKYSIVPSVGDLGRINKEELPLQQATLDAIEKEYHGQQTSFLVWYLIPGQKYSPIVYLHRAPQDPRDVVFVPCLHAHDSDIPIVEEHWDHAIYVVGVSEETHPEAAVTRFNPKNAWSLQPETHAQGYSYIPDDNKVFLPSQVMEILTKMGFPMLHSALKAPMCRILIKGKLLNGDIKVRGKGNKIPLISGQITLPSTVASENVDAAKISAEPSDGMSSTTTEGGLMVFTRIPDQSIRDPRVNMLFGGSTPMSTLLPEVETKDGALKNPAIQAPGATYICDCCCIEMNAQRARFRCSTCTDVDICGQCFIAGKHKQVQDFKNTNNLKYQHHSADHILLVIDDAQKLRHRLAIIRSEWVHKGVKCSKCKNHVVGYRCLCMACNKDLCESCAQQHYPLHPITYMPPPRVEELDIFEQSL